MKRKEKLNRFFNKVNQEFFILKNHLISCENIEQASAVSNWASNINDKWDNEMYMLIDDMGSTDYHAYVTQYDDLNNMMAKEWKELCENKINEFSEGKTNSQYPIVVKGFC